MDTHAYTPERKRITYTAPPARRKSVRACASYVKQRVLLLLVYAHAITVCILSVYLIFPLSTLSLADPMLLWRRGSTDEKEKYHDRCLPGWRACKSQKGIKSG